MVAAMDFMRGWIRGTIGGGLLLACSAAPVMALTWETTTREITLDLGTTEWIAEFPYRNDSDSPVTITDIKSGCDCSVPERPEKPIPAGGKGVLAVRYKPGTQPGLRTVAIEVRTDEAATPAAVLEIKATLEPLLTIQPVLLRWTRGETATAKRVTLRATGRAPIAAMVLPKAPETVTAEIAPGDESGTWILTIAPVSTESPLTVRVQVDAETGGKKVPHAVYAVVR